MSKPFGPSGDWPQADLEKVSRCPVCESEDRQAELSDLEDRVLGAAPGRWTSYRCCRCRCTYLDPRPNRATIGRAYVAYPSTEAITGRPEKGFQRWLRTGLANSFRNRFFGTKLTPSLPAGWLLASLAHRQAYSLRLDGRGLDSGVHSRGRRLLDVGCGNGTFLLMARNAGWESFGVEPDADAVAAAKARGNAVLSAHVEDLLPRFEGSFDAVTLSHVIEHVHDPVGVLGDCWALLKTGGFLWIETPNIESVGYAQYSSAWRGLEPPRHLVIFSQASLTRGLEKAGFKKISVLPPRDAIAYTFPRSALIKAGFASEAGEDCLSDAEHRALRLAMKRARSLVGKEPARSEYLTAICYKG